MPHTTVLTLYTPLSSLFTACSPALSLLIIRPIPLFSLQSADQWTGDMNDIQLFKQYSLKLLVIYEHCRYISFLKVILYCCTSRTYKFYPVNFNILFKNTTAALANWRARHILLVPNAINIVAECIMTRKTSERQRKVRGQRTQCLVEKMNTAMMTLFFINHY